MKIIRAPLRISLFGGGTDLEPFCSQHGSTIISFAINRYMYLTWNPRPTGGCRLSYSQVEELETLRDAQHTLVQEAAQVYGIDEPCTMTIVSDVPKGTGLGSSSALAVCLMYLVGTEMDMPRLVPLAHEMEAAHSRAGWQDYLPAVYGGLNLFHLYPNPGGTVPGITIQTIPRSISDIINRYGMLLYTGTSRSADSVLGNWQKSETQLNEIKSMADEVALSIGQMSAEQLGDCLCDTWDMKRTIPGVSNHELDWQYDTALVHGALGGKLCGAGSGGCWFFLVPPRSTVRAKVKNALGLREIPFQIAEKGVQAWEL